MPLPLKDNLVHLGLSPFLVNEIENQIAGLTGSNTFTGGTTQDFTACAAIKDPNNVTTVFGGSAANAILGTFKEEGNLYRNVANPIAGNGADTNDDILDGIQLPAGAFDTVGRGIAITAQGKLGATANNKRVRIWLNPAMTGQTIGPTGAISGGSVTGVGAGVLLFDSGVQTGNAVGYSMFGNLFKYGAAGSNTQYFQGSPIVGTTHGGIGLPVFATIPENAPINIVVTGASQTTGAANDVVHNFTEINAMN
jgi:hypothetical protein